MKVGSADMVENRKWYFLYFLAALPPMYIFLMIQYSAITVPFWDHVELIHQIGAWKNGSFHFSSLWEPHNQTRPLVYRFIMICNAILTNWDIRSEYIYIYMAIYGVFFVNAVALHSILRAANSASSYPIFLLLFSILLFSPVGHNNHWWSMMLQLDLTNLFLSFALLLVFANPNKFSAHIFAAIACWLASYTLTNGIFCFIAIGLTFQLTAETWYKPSRTCLFWFANFVVLLILYIPGIALVGGPVRPSILAIIQFCLVYLGAPLSGLIWFPYRNMFDVPISTVSSAVCGAFLVLTFMALMGHARHQIGRKHVGTMILIGFAIFSLLSAFATAWGRAAFDDSGVSNANSSRYTIFGIYFLLGQIYYVAANAQLGQWLRVPIRYAAINLVLGVFVVLSALSYYRALPIYENAHSFNRQLVAAYRWGLDPVEGDKLIYPDNETTNVKMLKEELQQFELGPYADRPIESDTRPIGDFVRSTYLSNIRGIGQSFQATRSGLKAISVKFIRPNYSTTGFVKWELLSSEPETVVAEGRVNTARIIDGEFYRLQLPYLEKSDAAMYRLVLAADADDAHAIVGGRQEVRLFGVVGFV